MSLLPSSPRRRRRLFTVGGGLAVVLIGVAIFLLLPSKKPPNPSPAPNEGAAQLALKTTRHVSAADRRAIDDLFDHFIPAAVGRKSAEQAWAYAGPGLRASSTLAQWRHGTTPVPSFPAGGKTFHGWGILDATKNMVDYNLLVHPRRGTSVSSWVFQGELVKIHGRWLVNSIYTTAIMAKPHNGPKEVGPADFTAQSPGGSPPASDAALSRGWLTSLIGVLVGVLVLIPLGLGTVILIRRRRWRRRVLEHGTTALPPLLPPAADSETERDKTPVA